NVRVGWEWAVQQHNLTLVSQDLEPLYDFYQIQSRSLEGRDAVVYAWRTLQESATAEDMRLAGILFRLLRRAGAHHYFLCEYDTAERRLREALAGMESTGQRADAAFILNFLGQLAGWQGEQERAKEYLLQSLAISREVGDKSATASALDKLANLTHATFGE